MKARTIAVGVVLIVLGTMLLTASAHAAGYDYYYLGEPSQTEQAEWAQEGTPQEWAEAFATAREEGELEEEAPMAGIATVHRHTIKHHHAKHTRHHRRSVVR